MNGDIEQSARESERLRVVLATIVLNIVAVLIFSAVPWSNWRTGLGLGLLDNVILIAYTMRRRDSLMAHLVIFGLVVGIAELAADAWLVAGTRTLDYSMGGTVWVHWPAVGRPVGLARPGGDRNTGCGEHSVL
jgi:hypothetical protein